MKWLNLAVVVAGAGLLGACQTARTDDETTAPAAETEPTPDLSERLAALEAQVAEARVAVQEAEARAARAERRAASAPASRPRAAAPSVREEEPAPVRVASLDPDRLPVPRSEPVTTPRPTPRPRVVVARGTRLELELETPLSSKTSRVGDPVVARVASATSPDGDTALPGGAYLEGHLTEVKASGRVSGRARLAARFDTLVVRGQRHSIDTSDLVLEADDDHGRDAKVVGGSAAAGAVIGGIAGGKRGLGKGILIGGAAGTAAVLATPGKDLELPSGFKTAVDVLTALSL